MNFIVFVLAMTVLLHVVILLPMAAFEGKLAKNNEYHQRDAYDNEYRYPPMRLAYDLGYKLAADENTYAERKEATRIRNKNRMSR
jgi:hypothetical protein